MGGRPTAGLQLIQHVLEVAPAGRVFTSLDALAAGTELGLSPEHVYKLLSELVARGLLERPRRRLYAMRPPLGGMSPVRPLAIAVHAVAPAAVSGDTALSHWGLLSQAALHEEVVSTSARIKWADGVRKDGADSLWELDGATIRFHRIPDHEMFGIASTRLDTETVVPMFDRERSLLELLTHAGQDAVEWAQELVHEHRHDIDCDRLRQYAARLGVEDRLITAARTG
jgi:predicted transcriptional regulator of viral defense system